MKALVIIAAIFGSVVASAACKEGSKASFSKYDTNNDHHYTETRTCVGGTYMTAAEKAAYVYNPSGKCKEGNRATFTRRDNINDQNITEVRTCKNGTYMTPAEKAAYVYAPKNKCVEGKIQPSERTINGKRYSTTEQCQSGKWIVIRKSPFTSNR